MKFALFLLDGEYLARESLSLSLSVSSTCSNAVDQIKYISLCDTPPKCIISLPLLFVFFGHASRYLCVIIIISISPYQNICCGCSVHPKQMLKRIVKALFVIICTEIICLSGSILLNRPYVFIPECIRSRF